MTETNTITRRRDTRDQPRRKRLSFEIDDRITLRIDFDLALELSDLIMNSKPDNPALISLGLQLRNLDKSTDE